MSTLEINKIIAAVLTAGIVASASGFFAEVAYYHEAPKAHAYAIGGGEAGEAEAAVAAAVPEGPPLGALLAAADPDAGRKVIKKCTACHTVEQGGANKIGPNLWNIVERPIAAAEGFSYSAALQERSNETWSYGNLDGFLTKPKNWAPGTKMSFAGLKKAAQRADLIAYLRTLSENPAALPE